MTRAPRLGLSFEIAPPQVADPLRTDIACFVGTVARRRVQVLAEPQALPLVLQRWLRATQEPAFKTLGGVPLDRLRVRMGSSTEFIESLLSLAKGQSSDRDRLAAHFAPEHPSPVDRNALADLLRACRELSPVPEAVLDDLRLRGFEPGRLLGPDRLSGWLRLQRLHNLPVVVESFEAFDALFAWDERGVRDRLVRPGDPVVATSLGAAVRAFFGEGGRRAYVLRTGDPSDVFDTLAGRFAACFPEPQRASDERNVFNTTSDRCPQLPGLSGKSRRGLLVGVSDQGTPPGLSGEHWQGLEHVYGLPDVSFAVLPDLIDACAQPVQAQVPPAEVVAAPEVFVECADLDPEPERPAGRRLPAPRLNKLGLHAWATLLRRALEVLDNPGRAVHRRDVQLLASLPLLSEGRKLPAPTQWLPWMRTQGWLDEGGCQAILSDRLQLAYPWVVSRDSADCQGGVEAPEGSPAGVLARSALERGAYRSAAHQPLRRWQDSEPRLPWTQALHQTSWTPLGDLSLAERLCLLGPAPRGPRLLSDVSCAAEAATRQASVRRLVNVVIQASRRAGDEYAFEPSGEALWSRVRERLSDLMRVLLAAGALSTDGVPFSVRCGRDTMRQNDLDAGRLIAEIELLPAQPISRIVVVLNLRDAGPSTGQAAPRALAAA